MMAITLADLIPLQPLLLVTLTVVIVMSAIAARRNYLGAYLVTAAGLLVAAFTAFYMMLPSADYQVTPLLIVDSYSLFFTGLICATAACICVFSYSYFSDLDDQKEEYFLLLAIATIGSIVLVSSNHFVSMVIGIETLSMSLYGMVAYSVQSDQSAKNSLEAAVKYLILSAAASGFLLFGMALIYAQTGTLEFSSIINGPVTSGLGEGFSVTALLLLFAGLAFKLSLAPFHMWTPDVYEGSPLPATIYLATIGKVATFVVLLRLIINGEVLSLEPVTQAISVVAMISIMVGNLLALRQENLKRILAYSSIAHMGYLLIALIASIDSGGTISVEAITVYLVAYVVMSLGAFGIASHLSTSRAELDKIEDYRGLFWRKPLLATIFTGMLLSLAGIPLTVGFIGKFYVFLSGVESQLWGLIVILIIGSGIGLYYYLRIVYRMVLTQKESMDPDITASSGDFGSQVVLVIAFCLLLFLGVYPTLLASLVESISLYVL